MYNLEAKRRYSVFGWSSVGFAKMGVSFDGGRQNRVFDFFLGGGSPPTKARTPKQEVVSTWIGRFVGPTTTLFRNQAVAGSCPLPPTPLKTETTGKNIVAAQ